VSSVVFAVEATVIVETCSELRIRVWCQKDRVSSMNRRARRDSYGTSSWQLVFSVLMLTFPVSVSSAERWYCLLLVQIPPCHALSHAADLLTIWLT
jgi:hypothetical protein